jgi:hypothetical protein
MAAVASSGFTPLASQLPRSLDSFVRPRTHLRSVQHRDQRRASSRAVARPLHLIVGRLTTGRHLIATDLTPIVWLLQRSRTQRARTTAAAGSMWCGVLKSTQERWPRRAARQRCPTRAVRSRAAPLGSGAAAPVDALHTGRGSRAQGSESERPRHSFAALRYFGRRCSASCSVLGPGRKGGPAIRPHA